jgi:hypothetical protein
MSSATPKNMRDHYDWTHPHDGRSVPAGGEFPYPYLADNGCTADIDRMRKDGWVLYQDYQHPKRDYKTRWWFRNLKAWHKYSDAIEAKGFVAIEHLKIT